MVGDERQRPEEEALDRMRAALQTESSDGLKLLKDLGDNPICSLSYDESIPCLVVIWKQYATSTQLRFVHENMLHLLALHGVSKILGDDTALPTIHTDDQEWILEDWMPRARAAELRAAANKSPSSYFGKLLVNTIQARAEGLALRSFDDVGAGRRWLENYAV